MKNMFLYIRSILFLISIFFLFHGTVHSQSSPPLPEPPSQEELDKLKRMGDENLQRYGSGQQQSAQQQAQPVTTFTAQPKLTAEKLTLWERYKGAGTTDLSKIDDLTSVSDLVLDTGDSFIFKITGSIDLTDQSELEKLDSIAKLWEYTETSFTIPEEWWNMAPKRKDINVQYTHPDATGFAPRVLTEEGEELHVDSKRTFVVSAPGMVTVIPHANMALPKESVKSKSIRIEGYVSHNMPFFSLDVNGDVTSIDPKTPEVTIDPVTGKYSILVDGLEEGENKVTLLSSETEGAKSTKIDQAVITVKFSLWDRVTMFFSGIFG